MEKLKFGNSGKYLDEEIARELLEKVRWPDGPICPHCVVVGGHYRVNPRKGSRSPVRPGVWKCRDCRRQFTVTVGTIFQGSKIPLSKWLTAIYLMGASVKVLNAHQLHRSLGLTYKSARFLVKRLDEGAGQGVLGKKLNSLLTAEGAHVVEKTPRKRNIRAKKKTGGLSVGKGKGSSSLGFLERLKSENLRGLAERTWRRFAGV
ncbi:MAG: IS1595 family transposase [Deltaproteobacteria bacterium]|nr:IS1595 family transposase [Deltaproteobacteria bacterium]